MSAQQPTCQLPLAAYLDLKAQVDQPKSVTTPFAVTAVAVDARLLHSDVELTLHFTVSVLRPGFIELPLLSDTVTITSFTIACASDDAGGCIGLVDGKHCLLVDAAAKGEHTVSLSARCELDKHGQGFT